MKALQHSDNPEIWGLERGGYLFASKRPTIFADDVSVDWLALRYGFDAVKDFVLVPVKVERV